MWQEHTREVCDEPKSYTFLYQLIVEVVQLRVLRRGNTIYFHTVNLTFECAGGLKAPALSTA